MKHHPTPALISYGLYPFLLATVIAVTYLSVRLNWNFKSVYGATTVFILATLMITERFFPLSKDWSMTGKSFFRDLRYILLVGPTIGLTKAAVGFFIIHYSETHSGPLANMPVALAAIAYLIVFEFFQYWFHRFSHSNKGPVGRFLWKAHVAHHLPDRVYVLMHAVFHPVNALLSTLIIQLTLIQLGISPAAALAATLMIDLQSLISHFNVDIRAGFFNYIFIGTETHRLHHAAAEIPASDSIEASTSKTESAIDRTRNFGNTLAIWDLVFGTFRYQPGINPKRLGIDHPESYPRSEQILSVLALPWRSGYQKTKV
jgi:sterol desaturase/sphingolipid hydroxylase (fatty acid hydroxylase superfamily)